MNHYLLEVIIGSFIGHLLADWLITIKDKQGDDHNETD